MKRLLRITGNVVMSRTVTVLLALLMVMYLLQGNLIGWHSDARVVLAIASLLLLQCAASVIKRVLYLSHVCCLPGPRRMVSEKNLLSLSLHAATGILFEKRFRRSGEHEATTVYEKGWRRSQIIEILTYAALIFTIISGLLDYGFGISGTVDVSPKETHTDLKSIPFSRGFFVKEVETDFTLRVIEISNTPTTEPSSIELHVEGLEGEGMELYLLEEGDIVKWGDFSIKYIADYYDVDVNVRRKKHDYQPGFIQFWKFADSTEMAYGAQFPMSIQGTRADGWYDPEKNLFRIKGYEHEVAEFDATLNFGTAVRDGDYSVSVPAMRHAARLMISRYRYQNRVIGGIAIALLIIARLVLRPSVAFLREEGGKTYLYTRNRSVRRLLREGRGQ